jgi:stearoyl-CoA desaturase (delta-9 desaturase)
LAGIFWGFLGSWGIAGGSHRLLAHRSYKANQRLKLLLVFFQTIALQNSCIEWVRDHRVHHKYSDTNADPHNASRGFFFSHMGWLLCKKHPDVKKYGNRISMADLEEDPVMQFQHKYYPWLLLLISIAMPILFSMFVLGDTFSASYHANIFRIVLAWHITWSINSVSHIWGNRPFEK